MSPTHGKTPFGFDISKILRSRNPKFKLDFPGGNDKVKEVVVADILYVHARGEISCIHTNDEANPEIKIAEKLWKAEERLKPYGFFRNHKSFLVNLSFVITGKKIDKEIELTSGEKLPLARRRKFDFLDLLKKLE